MSYVLRDHIDLLGGEVMIFLGAIMGLGFTDSFMVKKEGALFEWILFGVDTFFGYRP